MSQHHGQHPPSTEGLIQDEARSVRVLEGFARWSSQGPLQWARPYLKNSDSDSDSSSGVDSRGHKKKGNHDHDPSIHKL